MYEKSFAIFHFDVDFSICTCDDTQPPEEDLTAPQFDYLPRLFKRAIAHNTHTHYTPAVEFYGISRNSSFENFEHIITQHGFRITHSNIQTRTAEKGKFHITFTEKRIMLGVEVKNKNNIQF